MAARKTKKIPAFLLYGETGVHAQAPEDLVHVETIAARSKVHNWKIQPHLHRNLHQILLVTRGAGIAHAEGTATDFKAPAVIIVPEATVHAFDFEADTQGFVASIADSVLRECARSERDLLSLFNTACTFECSTAALRESDLRKAFQLFAHEFARVAPGRRAVLEALLTLILANVLRLSHRSSGAAHPTAGRAHQLVTRFRDLLERRFRSNLALREYAEALNVSTSRLRKACQKATAQSPMRLAYARVLLEAKRQLLYTNRGIGEIAYGLGFDDAAYFTRFFSSRVGQSPRAFRQNNPHGL